MAVKKRKIIDKWKAKKWYEVAAPKLFNSKIIGEAIAIEDNELLNRIVETSLMELGSSEEGFQRVFASIKVKLRINEVTGKTAHTKYIGHEISQSYLRTLARKGRSVIDVVADHSTKDGEKLRLKVVAITGSNVSQNTKTNIRKAISEVLAKTVQESTFEDLILDALYGKLAGKIYNRVKSITRMTKVEVKKVERKESFG